MTESLIGILSAFDGKSLIRAAGTASNTEDSHGSFLRAGGVWLPYEAHERLRSHRGVDLTGKLRVWACAQDDYIMLEFSVGRTVSNGKSFSDFQREKARSW